MRRLENRSQSITQPHVSYKPSTVSISTCELSPQPELESPMGLPNGGFVMVLPGQ